MGVLFYCTNRQKARMCYVHFYFSMILATKGQGDSVVLLFFSINFCDSVFYIREFRTLQRAVSVTFRDRKVTKRSRSKGEMGGESPLTICHFDGLRYAVKMTCLLSGFPDPRRLTSHIWYGAKQKRERLN